MGVPMHSSKAVRDHWTGSMFDPNPLFPPSCPAPQTPSGYYSRPLAPGWRIIVLDTTDLSLHAGHAPDSPEGLEAAAYLRVGVQGGYNAERLTAARTGASSAGWAVHFGTPLRPSLQAHSF